MYKIGVEIFKSALLAVLLMITSVTIAQENEDWLTADTIYQWALEAYVKHDTELVEQTSLYLWNASKHYLENNNYQQAFQYAFTERDLTLMIHGNESRQYALSLENLAGIYSQAQLYEEAIKYHLQAFELELALCDKDSTTFITPLHNVACDMSQRGFDHIAIDYMKAAIYYKNKAHYSEESIISSLSALAVMYSHIGDYKTAFDIDLMVLNYREDLPIDESLAISYSNLASDFNNLGLTQEAIEYAQKGLIIQIDSLKRKFSSHSATIYSNLSGYYISLQKYDEAISVAKKAIEINNTIHNTNQNGYVYQWISNAYAYKKDTIQALKYAELSVNSIKETTNIHYITALNNYAMLLYEYGYINEYVELFLKYHSQLRFYVNHLTHKSFPLTSVKTWKKYSEDIICHQKNLNAIIQYDTLKTIIYDNILFYKGILLDIEKNTNRSLVKIRESTNYDTLRTQYYSTNNLEEKFKLKQQIEGIENKLQPYTYMNSITIDTLLNNYKLTSTDIIIEILQGELSKKNVYYSLILRKDWNTPKCVILGDETQYAEMAYPQMQQAVWQAIIDSAQIKEGENIYFAPDGIFYNTPIEYLPTADGRNMSDVYNMFRVSSTRELCFRDSINQKYSSAMLYGGLRYDVAPQKVLAQNNNTFRGYDNMTETVWSSWRAEDRAKYNYLPYTLKEVDSISHTLNNTMQVVTYTDSIGDEKSFKALSGNSPSILHIATHGYYITPTQAEVMSKENMYRYGLTSMDERQSVIDYSMERTGLLLVGALHTLRGDSILQAAEDGILSAKEISHLDLSNTDLVVLSACQTALGDITNDGVAGLQRGFKIAGVKSILMSLWKVDDAATYLLMKRFYQSLMSGKSKQQALRDAQQYLRAYQVQGDYPYSDIRYWGAFVLLDAIE